MNKTTKRVSRGGKGSNLNPEWIIKDPNDPIRTKVHNMTISMDTELGGIDLHSSHFDQVSDLDVAKKLIKTSQHAKDRNLDFDLSFKTVKRLLEYRRCFYTNREFELDGPFARSFDRVDTLKGYIEGNVVACTIDINRKKADISIEEIELLYKKLILLE